MKLIRAQNLPAIALFCALGLIGLFPPKASAATVVVATRPGRYYHRGAYYRYHPRYGGYYNYHYRGRYYVYSNNGNYYNHRVWVAPRGGRRGYYRYW